MCVEGGLGLGTESPVEEDMVHLGAATERCLKAGRQSWVDVEVLLPL